MSVQYPRASARVLFALGVTMTLWASSFAVIKSAGAAYGAGELALLRFSAAVATLLTYGIFFRPRLPRLCDVKWFFLSGLLGVALYHPLLNYGEHVVSAGAASLLINSAPVWTAILAAILLRERVGLRRSLGIAASFCGITLLALGQSGKISLQPAAACIVGSAICAALYVIVQKHFLAKYSALEFTLWTFTAGIILLMPLFIVATVRTAIIAPPRATLEIMYLGIFPGALAYMAFAYATVRLPAAHVMSFMYTVPAMAMLIAWAYLNEMPTVLSLIGGALAIGGVAIVNAAVRQTSRVPLPEEG